MDDAKDISLLLRMSNNIIVLQWGVLKVEGQIHAAKMTLLSVTSSVSKKGN